MREAYGVEVSPNDVAWRLHERAVEALRAKWSEEPPNREE
jgi:hypothetical protein